MPNETTCRSCRKPKAIHECKICHESICKKCTQFLSEDAFSFLAVVPENLKHVTYCGHCFDQEVGPVKVHYDEVMLRARYAAVFFTTQRKEIPLISRTKDVLRVDDCLDRDETILRLAFLAVEQGFNGVIEVEVLPRKIRKQTIDGYQTSSWHGTAYPARIDIRRLDKQDLQNEMYRS